jgi:DNA adenine methylase
MYGSSGKYANMKDMPRLPKQPYTAGKHGKQAGKRLYTHSELDHERLFQMVSYLQGDFLMTYDHSEEVKIMARRYGFDTRLVPMKNTHHANMHELVIGRHLEWMAMPQAEDCPQYTPSPKTDL